MCDQDHFTDDLQKYLTRGSLTRRQFGLLTAGIMEAVRRWHARNCVEHRDELDRLLVIARTDGF